MSVALASALFAAGLAPLPAGLYGDTWMSPETGDVDGIELRVTGDRLTYYVAEGACSQPMTARLTPERRGWRFTYREEGDPGHGTNLWLTRDGGGVRLVADGTGRWLVRAPRGAQLKPLRQPLCFGEGWRRARG